MTQKVTLYTKEICPYCVRAKQLFDFKNIPYEEIRIDLMPNQREIMEKLSHRTTVPQIFIGARHVGGYDDLRALFDKGELDDWLKD